MNEIRPWLYIGKLRETLSRDFLQDQGIDAMLQLCRRVTHPSVETLFLEVEDGEPLPKDKLVEGIRFVRASKADGHKVLIACGAGISRSASFATAVLREEENLCLIDAYRQVKAVHPDARPHPQLWKSLCEYYGEDTPFLEILKRA